jgi:hypothetical protein
MVYFHFKIVAQKIVYEYLVDITKETKLPWHLKAFQNGKIILPSSPIIGFPSVQ